MLKRNSMFVVLHQQDEEKWLNPDLKEPTESGPLLNPYTPNIMEAYRTQVKPWHPSHDENRSEMRAGFLYLGCC